MLLNATRSRWAAACALLLTLTGGGCGDDDDDGAAAPNEVEQKKCEDARYGNGTCDATLSCGVPDIDCFRTFSSQQEAESWYLDFEKLLADEEQREPRALVPSTDPRWQRMRGLLDKGWESYRRVNQVGDLYPNPPALVVVNDKQVNAFVIPDLDSKRAGFAVMVHSAAIDANTGEGPMLGLVMHELEHSVGLHVLPGGRDKMRRYYIARGGSEPLGFSQQEDPNARKYGDIWRSLAEDAGPFDAEDLGGFPLGVSNTFARILQQAIQQTLDGPGPAGDCTGAQQALDDAISAIDAGLSRLDQSYTPSQPVRPLVEEALTLLRDECLGENAPSIVEVLGVIIGQPPSEAVKNIPERDQEIIEGKHVVDAIAALVLDRRAAMRAAQANFQQATGEPWTALRYFSFEEAADDATVPVLRNAGYAPDGLGEFFLGSIFVGADGTECRGVLDQGKVPPYGADLSDEHHASCWRVHHIRSLAAATPGQSSLVALPREIGPAPVARPRLLPPRISDLVVH